MPKETESIHGTVPAQGESSEEPSRPSGPSPKPQVLSQPDVGLPSDWRLPAATSRVRYERGAARWSQLRAKATRHVRLGEDEEARATWLQIAAEAKAAATDYASVIEALSRALEIKFDVEVRDELLGVLERCGSFTQAVSFLLAARATTPQDPKVTRKVAEYCIKSGDAARAATELTELARLDPEATDVLVALGTLAFWAPEQVSRERGILAWHEASRRLRKKGDKLGAFEAFARAFELDPASALAAERLASDLLAQGRREAADEVWRKSADAAKDPTRHDVRANAALESGDVMAAFAALLDGRADTLFDEQAVLRGVEQLLSPRSGLSQGFDMVLAEIGGSDWLAVRLELGPLFERWTDEATAHAALSRLEMSFFSHFEAAREASVRAIAVQPAHPEARARLTGLGGESQTDELLRALVQSARTAQDGVVARQLASELFERCQRDGGPAKLMLWSLERLRFSSFKGEARERQLLELRKQVESDSHEVASLMERLQGCPREARSDLLRELESRFSLDPTDALGHLSVTVELLQLHPTDPAIGSRLLELLDVAAGLVISPLRDPRLAAALTCAATLLGERGRMAQARFFLRHGQLEQALSALLPLLEDPKCSVRGLLWVLTLARRFRDASASARATERLAQAFRPAVRAMLEALAAQLYFEAGEPAEAFRVVRGALRVSQNVARLITLTVTLSECAEVDASIDELERSLSRVMPDSSMCRVMSRAYHQAAQFEMAYVWMQRGVSLRPGDLELCREALAMALSLGSRERVVEILTDLPSHALPTSGWVDAAASALAWLASVDPAQATAIASRLLDAAGPGNRSLRAALLDVAQRAGDERLVLEILERAAAAEAVDTERAAIHLALAERRLARREWEGYLRSTSLAAMSGIAVSPRLDLISAEGPSVSGEAVLLALELERHVAVTSHDASGSASSQHLGEVTRQLALARHDLAEDVDGAIALWVEYARLDTASGWPVVARDLVQVLGAKEALLRLESLARLGTSGEERGLLWVLAAQVAFEANLPAKAFELLELALQKSSGCTFVLALLEQGFGLGVDSQRLDAIYAMVDSAVLGVHGSRALHHRAAIAFVNRGEVAVALKHAVLAFEAHPDYEPSFQLLVQVCQEANDPHELVSAVTRIAELSRERAQAVAWLTRVYDVLRDIPDEQRLKFDLAIRILVGSPRVSAVRAVSSCLVKLEKHAPDEFEFMRQRFVRALESLTEDLEGPDGARLGIATFDVATRELERPKLAAAALLAAFRSDADVEEFEQVLEAATRFVQLDMASARSILTRILDWLDRPYTAIGSQAVTLLGVIGLTLGDTASLWRLERRASVLGRPPWLLTWLLEGKDCPWATVADPLKLATQLARYWVESGDGTTAIRLLDKGAEVAMRESRAGESENSGSWSGWQDCYQSSITLMRPSHDSAQLREHLTLIEPKLPQAIAAQLRVGLERGSSDARALSSALAELAFSGHVSPTERVALLSEAAQLAEELGDLEGAVAYLRACVGTSRHSTKARLSLGVLLYRLGRYHSPEQATFLLELVQGLEEAVVEEDRDLVVYLRAEALTATGATQKSGECLLDAELRLGPRTFIVLGLAERAFREGASDLALGYFATALGGNLRNIRSRSDVALLSARAAAATSDVTLALSWLSPALEDPRTRPDAMTLQAELQGAADALAVATVEPSAHDSAFDAEVPSSRRPAPTELALGETQALGARLQVGKALDAPSRSEALSESLEQSVFLELGPGEPPAFLPRLSQEPPSAIVPDEGEPGPMPAAREVEPFRTNDADRSGALLGDNETGDPEARPVQPTLREGGFEADGMSDLPGHALRAPIATQENASLEVATLEVATLEVATLEVAPQEVASPEVAPPEVAPPEVASPEVASQEVASPEVELQASASAEVASPEVELPEVELLEPTAFEFALAVAEELKSDPERLRAWLPDGRRWLRQWPMQLRLVELVQAASRLEGHLSHSHALEHVIALLRGEPRLQAPPELAEQSVDVEGVRALLLRDLTSAGAEALELIWDGAEHEFLRDPSEYEVTGLMRVVGTASPIARTYLEATRHLGMSRTPLFHRRTAQVSRFRVLLLNPTSILCEGDPVSDEALLAYRIGGALFATLPGHALIFALPEDQARYVFKALGLAFGSGGGQPNPTYGESLRLAQVLWQTVKSRSQRRLKEICQHELDFAHSFRQAEQSLRRAGLYVSGDLGCALRAVCEEVDPGLTSRDPARLLSVASRLPAALDLFRFATSAEYADVRWQVGRLNQPVGGTRPW